MTKIMIVDDEPDIIKAVSVLLKSEGYDIITAKDGDDCLLKLSEEQIQPDLILMDIMMPGTPVKKVIEQINPSIKIVYLTVVRMSELERKEMMTDNIVDFIQKPFDVTELRKRIKKNLSK